MQNIYRISVAIKMENPQISVVTVSYNTRNCIEKTILSVINQTYPHIEYLIIDGGSTDGTQEIVQRYDNHIAYFVSERDRGLYDGMNKGIAAATGDYLLFMNADDVFADNEVVEKIALFIGKHPEADVVYGNSEQILEYGTYEVRPKVAYINHKMAISHQATFVKLSLLQSHPFNLKYRYAADFEQLSSLYLDGHKFVYIDLQVARVEMTGGTTYNHHIESVNELYDIIESRGVDIARERRSMIMRKRIVRAFKQYLPRCITHPILRFLARHYKVL